MTVFPGRHTRVRLSSCHITRREFGLVVSFRGSFLLCKMKLVASTPQGYSGDYKGDVPTCIGEGW